ncbi:MAG: PAS domain S-box protein [Sphingobacteriales bacterium]|nr:MAG: PAS domain S-box protein [Sphingobacteriales bacterium]
MSIKNKNLRKVFIFTISFVILLSIYSYSKIITLIKSAEIVNNTTKLSLELEKVIGSLKQAETGSRGYLLTHDKKFLTDFNTGLKEYPENIKAVKKLIANKPKQQKRLANVENLAKHKHNYMLKMLEVDKVHSPTVQQLLVAKAIMDSLRTEVNGMVTCENKLLQQNLKKLHKQTLIAPAMLLILSLLALAIVIFAYWKLNKSLLEAQQLKADAIKQAVEIEKNQNSAANEKELKLLIKQAPVAIILAESENFIIKVANQNALQMMQKTEEEVIQKSITDFFLELPKQKEILNQVYATGISHQLQEVSLNFKSKEKPYTRCYDFNFLPWYCGNSNIKGVMLVGVEVTEKVIARKKIEESEQRFRKLVQKTPVAICLLSGKNFVVEIANNWQLKLWGKTPEQVLNLPRFAAIPEVEGHGLEALLNNVFTTGKPFAANEFPLTLVRNGHKETLYVNFNYQPFYNNYNEIVGVISVATDVTEQVLARQKVVESERLLYNLIYSSPSAIGLLQGEDFIISTANCSMVDIWGKGKELIGKKYFEVLPELKEQGYKEIFGKVYNTGISYNAIETPVTILQNGESNVKYYNIIVFPNYNANNQIDGLGMIAVDVTSQALFNHKIKESEAQFSGLADNIANLAWMANAEGWIYWYNKRWFEYTGTTMEQMKGWGWQSVHDPKILPSVMENWQNSIANGQPFEMVFPIKGANGNFREFLTRSVPIKDIDGKIINWVGTNTDITEQKKAEDQFKVLADQSPMWVWLTDKEINVLYANPELLKFIGISHYSKFTGHVWEQKVHPDDIALVYKYFGEGVSLQQSFSFELRIQNSINLQYEWFYLKGVPRVEENEFTGFIGTGININEQKLILSQLEYRKALLEAHIEASLDGILLVDTKGKILSYNQRFVDIWNMPQQIVDDKNDEAALAFALTQLLHPNQFNERVKWLYQHPNETSIDELEFLDGKIVKRYGYPVIAADGSYYAWSWIFRDITQQKKSEIKIKENEERFRSLAQTLPQLVWVTNAQGAYEFVSLKWKEYSGIEPGGEKEWAEIVHPDDYQNINAAWVLCLATGADYIFDVRLKSKSGEYRWHTVKGVPVLNTDGEIVKWVGAFTDIHEQKLKEEYKDEFISIASHEMKTPLTIAKAYLQMLEPLLIGNNEKAHLYTIKASQSVDRLNELTSELLDACKISLGKLNYTITTFDFNEMMDKTVENLELISPTHILIKTGEVYKHVTGDKDRLQQVVINLITNAIKYSPKNHEVFITLQQENDLIKVSVKDTGIGIAKQSLSKIFDKYHRLEEHALHYQGLGIGLFISYQIIERHQGKLWAESELGIGSTFYFTLPINGNSLANNTI